MNSELDIPSLVDELRSQGSETEWLEFKVSNKDPNMIGRDISALANSACQHKVPSAYMVWGVDDTTHEVIGSTFRYREFKVGNEELENWLHHQLSDNASFGFRETDVRGRHVTVLMIDAACSHTVDFERTAYVRVGSYTKLLRDYPSIEAAVWDRITQSDFEAAPAVGGLELDRALALIDYPKYFSLLGIPMPQGQEEVAHYLLEDGILCRQDDGRHAITNLGAILLAKRLRDFPTVSRKALRIVQYEDATRTDMLRERESQSGYACDFETAVEMIMALTPAREDIQGARRVATTAYPERAVREVLANALIHQDLTLSGSGPVVEIFRDRMDFTNPGRSLVEPLRLVDNPPRSRNQQLASLMRRFHYCEELGTGWDKIISSCEGMFLPAPEVKEYSPAGGSMRVTIMSYVPFRSMDAHGRLLSCYWHACICYTNGTAMSNQSLRSRFGDDGPSQSTVSRLIGAAVEAGMIKPVDPDTAPRYMTYVPAWA